MMAHDPVTGRWSECDASGPCDNCDVAPGPLYLVLQASMLCWRCRLAVTCPDYAEARRDSERRGAVVSCGGGVVALCDAASGTIVTQPPALRDPLHVLAASGRVWWV